MKLRGRNNMLLSYNRLQQLIQEGVINADPENVNAASIDITLAEDLLVEEHPLDYNVIDVSTKRTIATYTCTIPERGFVLRPNSFILASSNEIFNLPNNISAEYKLKSSMARCGLEHLNAGWCDAGWNNSKLTLELKNMTQHHNLLLRKGMKIGQIVFFEHEEVPEHASYANKGRYNNQTTVTAGKGV